MTIMYLFKNSSIWLIGLTLFFSGCIIDIDDGDDFFDRCVDGQGPIVTEEFVLSEIKGFDLNGTADIIIQQGNEQQIIVEGQQNIIDLIRSNVRGRIWEIDFRNCIENLSNLKITITIPEIEYMAISGSGSVFSPDPIVSDELALQISGSGDMDLLLEVAEVDADISGSGTMRLEGIADFHNIRISGSGDLKAFDFETLQTRIEINGSGDAEVNVVDDLNVKIRGSGDVLYRGNPALSVTISGSGEVVNAN